ncbi:hypothetical protein COB52_05120 [Candidatus Kaiserbacteria bacterium]|nr:MAG: hypothetical protein COB52_05120 [Candidatus Kaiserbacteria bacterium]
MIKSSHKKNKSVAYSGSGVQTPIGQNYPEPNAESKCNWANLSEAFYEFLKMGGPAKDSTDSIQKKEYNFNYQPYSPKGGHQR